MIHQLWFEDSRLLEPQTNILSHDNAWEYRLDHFIALNVRLERTL